MVRGLPSSYQAAVVYLNIPDVLILHEGGLVRGTSGA
jgi:hypothetical protein